MNAGRETEIRDESLRGQTLWLSGRFTPAENNIYEDKKMQYNVIQIRYQPRLTHREDPDSIPETVIVSLQLFPARPEDGIIPVAEKLDDSPKDKYCQKDPFPCRLKKIVGEQPNTIKAEHNKFSTLDPHSLDQKDLTEPVCGYAAEKPYP